MQSNKNSESNREEQLLMEYGSVRQLNEERLRFLSSRYNDEAIQAQSETSEPEPVNPFSNFQASVSEKKPLSPVETLQKKFSSSWLNMQSYLNERKQQLRNDEQRNR
ncbi:MAG TPA: hypothetical protein V6C97_28465 [Oculatellaceae cyanobacterium]